MRLVDFTDEELFELAQQARTTAYFAFWYQVDELDDAARLQVCRHLATCFARTMGEADETLDLAALQSLLESKARLIPEVVLCIDSAHNDQDCEIYVVEGGDWDLASFSVAFKYNGEKRRVECACLV